MNIHSEIQSHFNNKLERIQGDQGNMYLHHFTFSQMFLAHINYKKHEDVDYKNIFNVVKFHMNKFFTSSYNRAGESLEDSIQNYLNDKISV